MNNNYLFAIDKNSAEIIVSESPKGSNKINLVERLKRSENEILYNAVVTLTSIAAAPKLDVPTFKAMDKVCQLIYSNLKKSA
jgi:hypothetical protein